MTDRLASAVLRAAAPAGAGLLVGTIVTPADSNGLAVVDVDGARVNALTIASATSTAAGSSVLLARDGSSWFVVGRLGTAPAPPGPDDSSPSTPTRPPQRTTSTFTFRPRQAGSYRGSSWLSSSHGVSTGDWGGYGVYRGRVFYGNAPSGIRRVVRVNWGRVTLRRNTGGVFGAQTFPMVLITQKSRPSGSGTVQASTAGPSLAVGKSTVWTMPKSWAEALVDGSAGGLGIGSGSSSPYIRTPHPGDVTSSWTLQLNVTYSAT